MKSHHYIGQAANIGGGGEDHQKCAGAPRQRNPGGYRSGPIGDPGNRAGGGRESDIHCDAPPTVDRLKGAIARPGQRQTRQHG